MFRRNYCIAAGNKGRHHFDKTTHQCACGRWDRGFAPKKVLILPRHECQICEATQATRDGLLVNHGYRRPGIGFLLGGCPGTNRRPFPQVDTLEAYLVQLNRHQEKLSTLLADLRTATSITHTMTARHGAYEKKQVQIEVLAGTEAAFYTGDTGLRTWIPSFEQLKEDRQRNLTREIGQTMAEVTRVTARIKKGQEILAGGA